MSVADRLSHAAVEFKLAARLRAASFPLSLDDALDTAHDRRPEIARWAREGMLSRAVARTAQAEQIAAGRSLAEVASATGISQLRVLEWLSVGEDYFGAREDEQSTGSAA